MTTRSRKRDSILQAARAEFAEHGFAGARVARIAAGARVNKQLIFYYFGSKAGLHAAVAHGLPAAGPRAGDGTPPERLRGALGRLLAELGDRPELASLLVDPKAGAEAASAAREYLGRLTGELAVIFSDGQGMGYFRDDLDPEVAARQAVALMAGFVTLRHLPDGADGDRRRWSQAAADLFLRAAAW